MPKITKMSTGGGVVCVSIERGAGGAAGIGSRVRGEARGGARGHRRAAHGARRLVTVGAGGCADAPREDTAHERSRSNRIREFQGRSHEGSHPRGVEARTADHHRPGGESRHEQVSGRLSRAATAGGPRDRVRRRRARDEDRAGGFSAKGGALNCRLNPTPTRRCRVPDRMCRRTSAAVRTARPSHVREMTRHGRGVRIVNWSTGVGKTAWHGSNPPPRRRRRSRGSCGGLETRRRARPSLRRSGMARAGAPARA